jgi:hypothetical protein
MHGDVPVATAIQPISETPQSVAALTASLLVIDAAQQDLDGGSPLLPHAMCRIGEIRNVRDVTELADTGDTTECRDSYVVQSLPDRPHKSLRPVVSTSRAAQAR